MEHQDKLNGTQEEISRGNGLSSSKKKYYKLPIESKYQEFEKKSTLGDKLLLIFGVNSTVFLIYYIIIANTKLANDRPTGPISFFIILFGTISLVGVSTKIYYNLKQSQTSNKNSKRSVISFKNEDEYKDVLGAWKSLLFWIRLVYNLNLALSLFYSIIIPIHFLLKINSDPTNVVDLLSIDIFASIIWIIYIMLIFILIREFIPILRNIREYITYHNPNPFF